MSVGPKSLLLADRVAVVTGAAVGIGEAVAVTLARFGAHLAICDRDAENLASTTEQIHGVGRRVLSGVFDVREPEAVKSFLEKVSGEFEQVDILVNNAGGGFYAPFLKVKPKGQDALIHENFSSVTHFIRGVVPLIPDRGGSIINLTSIEAHRAAPGYALYSAMKAAISNLTKSLALELGDRNIRVNCIAPDMIPTPGIGRVEPNTPLPRPGHVNDIAGAALFLASELSGFVTGSTLHVDGGNHAAGGWKRNPHGAFET